MYKTRKIIFDEFDKIVDEFYTKVDEFVKNSVTDRFHAEHQEAMEHEWMRCTQNPSHLITKVELYRELHVGNFYDLPCVYTDCNGKLEDIEDDEFDPWEKDVDAAVEAYQLNQII